LYAGELADSKDSESQKLLKKLKKNYNLAFAEKLMKLYLDRCKVRHALAFFQFRRMIPGCHFQDLMNIFFDRKEYMIKIASMCKHLISKGFLYSKKPYKPADVSGEHK